MYAEKPQKDIHSFIGKLSSQDGGEESLSIENTVWCGAVVASGTATGEELEDIHSGDIWESGCLTHAVSDMLVSLQVWWCTQGLRPGQR